MYIFTIVIYYCDKGHCQTFPSNGCSVLSHCKAIDKVVTLRP